MKILPFNSKQKQFRYDMNGRYFLFKNVIYSSSRLTTVELDQKAFQGITYL